MIFSHTGEHLNDLECEILEGVINHQTYGEIAKIHYRSAKYVRDTAGKLWKTLSKILEEKVTKSNIQTTIQRYYNTINNNLVNDIQINEYPIHDYISVSELQRNKLVQEIKLEIATELIKEGFSAEKIAKTLKLPLALVLKIAIEDLR